MAWCWRSPALSSDSRRGRALSSCLKLFFFKQKTAYEIDCDWSSDVCSSDLAHVDGVDLAPADDADDLVAGLLDRQRLLDDPAVVPRHLDRAVVAEDVGRVEHE